MLNLLLWKLPPPSAAAIDDDLHAKLILTNGACVFVLLSAAYLLLCVILPLFGGVVWGIKIYRPSDKCVHVGNITLGLE